MEIDNIFVILTPYQKRAAFKLFEPLFNSQKTLVFHSKYTSLNEVECQVLEIDNFQFSRRKLFQLDLPYYRQAKKAIKRIRNEISHLEEIYSFNTNLDIYFGSEKDVFTQMLLQSNFIADRISNVFAIEEGLGYYKNNPGIKTKVLKFVYKVVTPILFKERLKYVYTLGVDSRITCVYARFPELLPLRKKSVEYFKIPRDSGTAAQIEVSDSNKVLVYSFPNKDYGMSEDKKERLYHNLISSFPDKEIYIKPHPREEAEFFKRFNDSKQIRIIDGSRLGEELTYYDYEKILNFSSSIVVDILMSGYPGKNIYTIFINRPPGISLFEQTHCIQLSELNNYNFET